MLGAEAMTEWAPDWATHPGEHLAEHIEARGWSQAEFARLANMTPKLVSTIISGANPVTAETAIKLERVTGMRDYIWAQLQAAWDLRIAHEKEKAALKEALDWAREFPLGELMKRGAISPTQDPVLQLGNLLGFLGIGAPKAFPALTQGLAVQHRQSRARATSQQHVVAWLLLGERKARQMETGAFSLDAFENAVHEIRKLTVKPAADFEPQMTRLCKDAGVALVFEKPITKTCLFGSARWLDNGVPVIQMSLRMKSNDHFWWTFFHEAAHIILHRGRAFVDDHGGEGDGAEHEADFWATDILVGADRFEAFKASLPSTGAAVIKFASETGIHPGIVVGMLQHAGIVPYSHLNGLKARFHWADEAA